MSRFGFTLAILASSVLASACTDDEVEQTNTPPSGATSGDEGTTFDHDNSGISPWELLERLQQEGPPSFTARVHSCPKVRYRTLGTVLRSLGVNAPDKYAIPAPTAPALTDVSPAGLYWYGDNAMGAPNYDNRIRENIGITTSGASRMFDLFAASSQQVIDGFTNGTIARCPGAQLFDGSNACRPDGITCLIGAPATSRHIDYCNLTVTSASDVTVGKRLAVATMLAAAYTCE